MPHYLLKLLFTGLKDEAYEDVIDIVVEKGYNPPRVDNGIVVEKHIGNSG